VIDGAEVTSAAGSVSACQVPVPSKAQQNDSDRFGPTAAMFTVLPLITIDGVLKAL